MARQALSPIAVNDSYASGSDQLVWTAADVANGDQVTFDGRSVVLIDNTGGSPYYVRAAWAAGEMGRTGYTEFTIPAGETHVLPFFKQDGWKQTGNLLHLNAENAAVKYCVLGLPR